MTVPVGFASAMAKIGASENQQEEDELISEYMMSDTMPSDKTIGKRAQE